VKEKTYVATALCRAGRSASACLCPRAMAAHPAGSTVASSFAARTLRNLRQEPNAGLSRRSYDSQDAPSLWMGSSWLAGGLGHVAGRPGLAAPGETFAGVTSPVYNPCINPRIPSHKQRPAHRDLFAPPTVYPV
jgi:hypothetical protein